MVGLMEKIPEEKRKYLMQLHSLRLTTHLSQASLVDLQMLMRYLPKL
jgi:hypothetical protein